MSTLMSTEGWATTPGAYHVTVTKQGEDEYTWAVVENATGDIWLAGYEEGYAEAHHVAEQERLSISPDSTMDEGGHS